MMGNFLRFYWFLDEGLLTWGLAKFCLLFTLCHVFWKITRQLVEPQDPPQSLPSPKTRSLPRSLLSFSILVLFAGLGAYSLAADVIAGRIVIAQKLYNDIKIGEMDNEPATSLQAKTRESLQVFAQLVDEGIAPRDLIVNYALLLLKGAENARAAEVLQTFLVCNPDDGDLRIILGRAFLNAGRKSEAVVAARQGLAKTQNPTFVAWAYKTLIEGHLALGQGKDATDVFQQQMSTLTGNPEAQKLLTEYFERERSKNGTGR